MMMMKKKKKKKKNQVIEIVNKKNSCVKTESKLSKISCKNFSPLLKQLTRKAHYTRTTLALAR